MSMRLFIWAVFASIAVAALVGGAVWLLASHAPEAGRSTLQVEAIRAALTAAVATGGTFALLIQARKQRTEELRHELEEKKFKEDRLLESEKRATEVFSKSIEQLSNEAPAVRLGGVYTLGQLANSNTERIQQCVDILCLYLRTYHARFTENEEDAVADAAVDLLARHLNPAAVDYWPNVRLNLRGAILRNFKLSFVDVQDAIFDEATFVGTADFSQSHFKWASFKKAAFKGNAWFGKCIFDYLNFEEVLVEGRSNFVEATFASNTFAAARFIRPTTFSKARFTVNVSFGSTLFGHETSFKLCEFPNDTQMIRWPQEHYAFTSPGLLRPIDPVPDLKRVVMILGEWEIADPYHWEGDENAERDRAGEDKKPGDTP
jgi:hypothetical protein